MNLEFIINGEKKYIDLHDSSKLEYGKPELLSNSITDINYYQKWYKEGFYITDFLTKIEFQKIFIGIENCIKGIVKKLQINLGDFELEKYHHFINEENHQKIVSKTRDLFPDDFNFNIKKIIQKLENILGFELTDVNPFTKEKTHIIVRINRPKSNDYNPPHKDVYELFDQDEIIQKITNFWIPICGVTQKSMLPIVPESHLITEDKIFRTFEGGIVNNKKYHVRSVVEWDKSKNMKRPEIKDGQILIFTPNLIHGCAINDEEDKTRVALEFRLYKKWI